MSKPDKNGVVDVDGSLVDSDGVELSDNLVNHTTLKQIEESDARILREKGEYDPDSDEAKAIAEKMKYNSRGIFVE